MKLTGRFCLALTAAMLCAAATGCSGAAPSSQAVTSSGTFAESAVSSPAVSAPAAPSASDAAGGLSAPVGEKLAADLNGDGKDDTILYDADPDDEEHPVHSLTINGTEFKDQINQENGDVWIYFPCTTAYYVTDLDTSDTYKELAILDAGPSDDPTTYFFRYDGTNLTCLGYVTDLLGSNSCRVKGDGTVQARLRLSVLQTWFTTATWQLQGGSLQQADEALYTPWYYNGASDFSEMPAVTLAQNLKVYAAQDKSSATTTWEPSEEVITFPATDNKSWVEVQRGSETGWIYLTDYCTLDNDGETDANVVFTNLFQAD